MRISIIAAMDRNRVIGYKNGLPWRLPADLKHFKALTLGKPILMGRRTWDSLGRPLPGRQNVVVTRTLDFVAAGCTVAHSVDEALKAAAGHPEVMVIGGASFYAQLLPAATRMYLTRVDAEFEGDAWFPEFAGEQWREVARHDFDPDEKNPYPYRFVELERCVG